MRTRAKFHLKAGLLSLSVMVALGILLFAWPSAVPLHLAAADPEMTELVSEAGEEMCVLPITISVPGKWPEPNSAVFFKPESTRAEARLGSTEWVDVHCTLPADRISAGWTSEGTILLPARAQAVRLRLKCAGRSFPWRVAGLLSACGVELPSKIRARLGPLPGRKPPWKEVTIEIALAKGTAPHSGQRRGAP